MQPAMNEGDNFIFLPSRNSQNLVRGKRESSADFRLAQGRLKEIPSFTLKEFRPGAIGA